MSSIPTLILLPGLHGTADLFSPLLDVLPKDLPGGLIPYPTDRCRSYAHHLRRIEKELDGQANLVLFAESFSGPLAIKFAATYPDRVRALILCGTFISNPVPRILCLLAPIPILLCCPIPAFAIRFFLAGASASSQLVRETRRAIRLNSPLVLAHRVAQAAWLDACDDLKNCRAPVLCLAATRDRLVGRRSVRRISRIRPDIPVRPIDAPHLLLQSQPTQVWQHVSAFLQHTAAPIMTNP